jgi:hypothetical protein
MKRGEYELGRTLISSVEYTKISTWSVRMSASRPFVGPRMPLLKRRRRSKDGRIREAPAHDL